MKDWISQSDEHFVRENANRVNIRTGRPNSFADRRTQSRGRAQRSKSNKGDRQSLSPDSRIRRQGQQFLSRIEELQKTLEVQGEQLVLVKDDLTNSPHRFPKSNLARETESQRLVSDNLRRQLEAKKLLQESLAAGPKVAPRAPVNYNEMRKQDYAEVQVLLGDQQARIN